MKPASGFQKAGGLRAGHGPLLYAGSHLLTKLRKTLEVVNETAPVDPSRPWLARLAARGLCAAPVAVSLKGALDVYFRHTMLGSFAGGGVTFLLFLFRLVVSIQAFLAGAEIAVWMDRKRRMRRT